MNEYRDVDLTKKMERKTGLAGLPRDNRRKRTKDFALKDQR